MEQDISDSHDKCSRAFGTLLRASSTHKRFSEQLPHHALIDLYGRFNIWAGNIGAGKRGRASLDYRLREAAYIKESIVQILRSLTESAHEGLLARPFALPVSDGMYYIQQTPLSRASGHHMTKRLQIPTPRIRIVQASRVLSKMQATDMRLTLQSLVRPRSNPNCSSLSILCPLSLRTCIRFLSSFVIIQCLMID